MSNQRTDLLVIRERIVMSNRVDTVISNCCLDGYSEKNISEFLNKYTQYTIKHMTSAADRNFIMNTYVLERMESANCEVISQMSCTPLVKIESTGESLNSHK